MNENNNEHDNKWNLSYIIVAIVIVLILLHLLIPALEEGDHNVSGFFEEVQEEGGWYDRLFGEE